MTDITLIRPKERFNKRVDYSIFINRKHVADLKNDSQEIINLDTKNVTVKAKIKWCGSRKHSFKLSDNENHKLHITGVPFFYYFGILACFLSLLVISSIVFPEIETIEFAATSVGSLMIAGSIFSVTVQKNKWIKISQF